MADTKEKLFDLMMRDPCPSPVVCDPHCKYYKSHHCHAERYADHLIANGVTVQEWISVKDRLPEPETDVIAFVGDYIDILSYRYDRRGNLAFMYMDDSGWWHERIRPSVTHWILLPEPPKGE